VIWNDMTRAIEPESRNLGEDCSFTWDGIRQHNIERTQSIARNDQHVIGVDCVNIPNLALMNSRKALQIGFEQRRRGRMSGHVASLYDEARSAGGKANRTSLMR
jgi:hypothetical protein